MMIAGHNKGNKVGMIGQWYEEKAEELGARVGWGDYRRGGVMAKIERLRMDRGVW